MNKLLIDLKYLQVDIWDLIFGLIIIGIAVYLTSKVLKSRKSERHHSKIIVLALLWVFTISLTAFLVIPSLEKITLFETNLLILNPFGVALILVILFINLFFIETIKLWFEKTNLFGENKTFVLFRVVLWLVSLHFILKIIIKKYEKFTEFVIFKIQNTSITIGNIFFVVLALAVTAFLVIMIRIAFNRLAKRKKIDYSTAVTLQNITKYFVWVFAVIIILESIGFNLSVLLAGSAALMVGLGMGIQQVFNDFASGLILLFERQIKVDDYVEADNVAGTVLDIGFRTTLLLTRDNVKIIIPNSKLVSGNVINWTKGEKYARIGIDIGVAYGSDVQVVKEMLIRCAKQHEDVLTYKEPEVFFIDFGDSALIFRLYFYIEKIFYRERIKSDLRFSIYEEFNKAGVQIPFPQVDVHLDK